MPEITDDLDALETAYRRDGHILLRGVLSASEVQDFRGTCQQILDNKVDLNPGKPRRGVYANSIIQHPDLIRRIFHPRIVAAMKKILGPTYTVIPSYGLIRNQVGMHSGRYLGIFTREGSWHLDCSSEGKQAYLMDPDYRFVRCGIYLQDNTAEWGGGVDVVSGTHRLPFRTGVSAIDWKIKSFLDHYGIVFRSHRVDTKAGDVLIFDSRVPHASTIPTSVQMSAEERRLGQMLNVPKDKEKIVFYFEAGREQAADRYMENASKRADAEAANQYLSTYSALGSVTWPDNYPAEIVELARVNGVRIATVSREQAERIRSVFSEKGLPPSR